MQQPNTDTSHGTVHKYPVQIWNPDPQDSHLRKIVSKIQTYIPNSLAVFGPSEYQLENTTLWTIELRAKTVSEMNKKNMLAVCSNNIPKYL